MCRRVIGQPPPTIPTQSSTSIREGNGQPPPTIPTQSYTSIREWNGQPPPKIPTQSSTSIREGNGQPPPTIPTQSSTSIREGKWSKKWLVDFNPNLETVLLTDGQYKLIYTINGQYPGPSIVVYQGQQVEVVVKNRLMSEGVTIHWHGLIQWGTPWMDGVGSLSHCPINPEQTFTYSFLAEPSGTHWHHSHHGAQRTEGLTGALVVLERKEEEENEMVDVCKHLLVLTLSSGIANPNSWLVFFRGFDADQCFVPYAGANQENVGFHPFESILMNGKGNTFLTNMTADSEQWTVETFNVTANDKYRFRVISATMVYPLQVSVDQLLPSGNDTHVPCIDAECQDICDCTNIVKLAINDTIQLVLLNMNNNRNGLAHGIHIHGHHVHVIKVGYPKYNTDSTGPITQQNADILFDTPIWFWFMHCHMEPHAITGMALILQEGETGQMPTPPSGLQGCGNFFSLGASTNLLKGNSLLNTLSSDQIPASDSMPYGHWDHFKVKEPSYIAVICILCVLNITSLAVLYMKVKYSDKISNIEAVKLHRRIEVNERTEPETFVNHVYMNKDDKHSYARI
ncbi:uncharacterized protein LOC110462682 [Mizuhopecten yessoensis]|uniref:uncharacterized protein LOC110462682 n=1 Tax=Mizuhopecten yessoensis TaxID=6573 RepID=UPI000B45956F|nr:uncharacterized protein LOC110462682 [Mizuhopecten yessoensis]